MRLLVAAPVLLGPLPASTSASASAIRLSKTLAQGLDLTLVRRLLHLRQFQDLQDLFHLLQDLPERGNDLIHLLDGLSDRGG